MTMCEAAWGSQIIWAIESWAYCHGCGSSFWLSYLFLMDNTTLQYKFLSWNVRGMNNSAREEDVRQVVATFRLDLVCLQETKMMNITHAVIRSVLGTEFEIFFLLGAFRH